MSFGRLLRRAEFLRVAATKRKWVAPGLILQVGGPALSSLAEATPAKVRLGFTASRRVGNSVARNRARRRLKAAAREVLSDHSVEPCDMVLVARPATVDRDYQLLLQDLREGLKRCKVLAKEDGA